VNNHPVGWAIFALIVVAMLVIDLGIFHRKAHALHFREALVWSMVWIVLALVFNVGIFFAYGSQRGLEFLAAYLIEKSLSVDNLFAFLAIFTYFGIKAEFQHRVLMFGILGALAMRGVFIFVGLILIDRFAFLTYLLGALLVVTGIRFAKQETEIHPEKNPVVRFIRWIFPVASTPAGQRFFVRENGCWHVTPLFIVLMVVETMDIVFAADSVPAVLAISKDPFIVYTSNIFAILGLRALYFLLTGAMVRFAYLKYGLAILLVYVGIKMLMHHWMKVPTLISLAVIGSVLFFSILLSVVKQDRMEASGR